MIFFFSNGFILKKNISSLFCDIMSSHVTSLLLNVFLFLIFIVGKIGCYIISSKKKFGIVFFFPSFNYN